MTRNRTSHTKRTMHQTLSL